MKIIDGINLLSNAKVQKLNEIGFEPFVLLFLVTLITSFFITFAYQFFYGHRNTGSQLHRSFPILMISITAIFLCLQFSIPLSLGLLGALSIVRFRTPIKEAEEVSFILVIIALSICFATFNFKFAYIILFFVIIALFLLNKTKLKFLQSKKGGAITVSFNPSQGDSINNQLADFIKKNEKSLKVDAINKTTNLFSYSLKFSELNENQALKWVDEISTINNDISVNIYFNKSSFFS